MKSILVPQHLVTESYGLLGEKANRYLCRRLTNEYEPGLRCHRIRNTRRVRKLLRQVGAVLRGDATRIGEAGGRAAGVPAENLSVGTITVGTITASRIGTTCATPIPSDLTLEALADALEKAEAMMGGVDNLGNLGAPLFVWCNPQHRFDARVLALERAGFLVRTYDLMPLVSVAIETVLKFGVLDLASGRVTFVRKTYPFTGPFLSPPRLHTPDSGACSR